jgi:hypothetical protein
MKSPDDVVVAEWHEQRYPATVDMYGSAVIIRGRIDVSEPGTCGVLVEPTLSPVGAGGYDQTNYLGPGSLSGMRLFEEPPLQARLCSDGGARFVPPMFTRGESPGAMVVRLQVAESVGDLARGEGGDGACCPER